MNKTPHRRRARSPPALAASLSPSPSLLELGNKESFCEPRSAPVGRDGRGSTADRCALRSRGARRPRPGPRCPPAGGGYCRPPLGAGCGCAERSSARAASAPRDAARLWPAAAPRGAPRRYSRPDGLPAGPRSHRNRVGSLSERAAHVRAPRRGPLLLFGCTTAGDRPPRCVASGAGGERARSPPGGGPRRRGRAGGGCCSCAARGASPSQRRGVCGEAGGGCARGPRAMPRPAGLHPALHPRGRGGRAVDRDRLPLRHARPLPWAGRARSRGVAGAARRPPSRQRLHLRVRPPPEC